MHRVAAAGTPTNRDDRITLDPLKCGGKPCSGGMRIRVSDILELLAGGATHDEILADFHELEPEDSSACLHFAARRTDLDWLPAA